MSHGAATYNQQSTVGGQNIRFGRVIWSMSESFRSPHARPAAINMPEPTEPIGASEHADTLPTRVRVYAVCNHYVSEYHYYCVSACIYAVPERGMIFML